MTKVKKIDKKFIGENKQLIINSSIDNAERLYKDAKLLMDNESYATAQGRIIEALEELAKASLLEKDNFSALEDLIKHDRKAIEVMNLSAQCYQIPTLSQERIKWAQERIPQMREDSTYVRLKPMRGNNIKPDNKYWKKRAKSFFNFLGDILKKSKAIKR